jgi:hypothetical protein
MTESAPQSLAAPPRSRDATRQAWIDRLARFATAGLRPAAFCAAEGISLASFYLWKRRLGAPAAEPAGTDAAPRLLPVRLAAAAPPLELVLPTGVVVRLSPDTDPAKLAALLRLLGVLSC